jgi:hypothetical protein
VCFFLLSFRRLYSVFLFIKFSSTLQCVSLPYAWAQQLYRKGSTSRVPRGKVQEDTLHAVRRYESLDLADESLVVSKRREPIRAGLISQKNGTVSFRCVYRRVAAATSPAALSSV